MIRVLILSLATALLQYEDSRVLGDLCTCPSSLGASSAGYSSGSFSKLDDNVDVVNPGRGMYRMAATNMSKFSPLESHFLNSNLNIVLRLYYLDTYITDDLDADFVSKVKTDLAMVQSRGWTVILRFAYTKTCSTHDASLSQMLKHIHYLDSHDVFRGATGGVIAAIQAGFIGKWGEWHYWDENGSCPNKEFGEAGGCSSTFNLTPDQWSNRKKILQALLNASPKYVDIQVRIPAYKYHLFGKTATTLADDRAETDASRISYHNDALLSGPNNQGTFLCNNDATFMDSTFMADDSKYTVVTGETNDHNITSYYECGKAKSDLVKYHYSTVHVDFDECVISYWKDHGCYKEIAARLGYRLYLINAILPNKAQSSGQFCYKITLHNNGYSAPYKPFEARIVLQNTGDGSQHRLNLPNVDVRTWQPGEDIHLSGSVTIPSNLHGNFTTYLVLAHETMPSNSKYYVLLANKNVQQTSSRMNDLHHTVSISSGTCSGTSGSGTCHSLHLSDGSFESNAHGWKQFSQGFTVRSDSHADDGTKIIRVTNGAARQTIDFSSSPVHEFRLSGYSRHNSGTHVSDPADYSIYCDLVHTDDTETYGKTSNFDSTSTPNVWHLKELHVHTSKLIREATCYTMFRNGHGYAEFDHFQLSTCSGGSCAYQTLDGSFEVGDGWEIYNSGFSRKHSQSSAQSGNYYITVTNGGASQYIDFDSGTVTRFTLSGYSKAHSVSGVSGSDYCIYCDLTHPDHKNTWGEHADFDPTKSSWQKAVLQVVSQKVISGARCYAMFRNGHGSADFDNFQLDTCA